MSAYNYVMQSPIHETLAYLDRILDEILLTRGSARNVALSFAIGTFVALLPTLGFGFFFCLLLLILIPRLHKPGMLSAFIVWNPLVQIPLYTLSIYIGTLLFSDLPVMGFEVTFMDHVYNFTRRVLIGNVIVTSVVACISYMVVYILIRAYKNRPLFPDENDATSDS